MKMMMTLKRMRARTRNLPRLVVCCCKLSESVDPNETTPTYYCSSCRFDCCVSFPHDIAPLPSPPVTSSIIIVSVKRPVIQFLQG